MAQVTLSLSDGWGVVDEFPIVHNPDECDLDEALCSGLLAAGYPHLARANWIQESKSELRCVVDKRVIYIAEVAA